MSMATTPSSHTDWVQQYQQSAAAGSQSHYPRGPAPSSAAAAAESTVVTTVTTTSPSLSAGNPSTQQPSQQQQPGGGGGRAARPARRRTRASRRAPTTLLNTDTTNFRAMVHQFTGAPPGALPSAPFASSFYLPAAGSGTSLVDFGQLPLQQQQQPQVYGGAQLFQVQQQHQQQHDQQLLDGGMFGLAPNTTSNMDHATAAYFHGLGGSGIGDQRS